MTVLFVCVHNAGRSQMAEAFLSLMAEERGLPVRALSAGTKPWDLLDAGAVEAMEEAGIPIAGKEPKVLTPEMVEDADVIVTMGCGVDADSCPTAFTPSEDWGLDDPADLPLDGVRIIRDEIRRRVAKLLDRFQARTER